MQFSININIYLIIFKYCDKMTLNVILHREIQMKLAS